MKSKSGFTLVEILVVISIIVILSALGLVAYSSAQKQARDGKRKADIDAVAKVLEGSYDNSQGRYLLPINTSLFVNGIIPIDPLDNQNSCYVDVTHQKCFYCWSTTSTACANSAYTAQKVSDFLNSTNPVSSWIICANLEDGSYICRSSRQ